MQVRCAEISYTGFYTLPLTLGTTYQLVPHFDARAADSTLAPHAFSPSSSIILMPPGTSNTRDNFVYNQGQTNPLSDSTKVGRRRWSCCIALA